MLNSFKHLFAKSDIASSLFYTLSNKFLVVVLNLLSFLIIVRFLTEEQMGVWAIFLSITTIFEVARGALIKNALIRLLNSEDTKNIAKVQSAGLLLNIFTAITISLIIIILILCNDNLWHVANLSNMLGIYILSTLVFTFFFHVEFILQAKADFRTVFQMYLLKQSIFLCLLVCLALLHEESDKLSILVLFQFIGVFISTAFAFYVSKSHLKHSKPEIEWIAKLWNYGKYILATNINSLIFRNTDHFMVAALISPTAVAYYNVAIRITNFLDLPSTAASEALFPKSVMLSHSDSKEKNKKLYEVTVGVIIASLIPLTLLILLFSEETITFIASEKYIEAKPILQITLFYSLLLPFLKQFGMIMDSIGEAKLNTKLTVILSISNFFFNYFLIKHIGLNGAAYGTFITYTIGAIFAIFFLHRLLNVSLHAVLKQIFSTYITLINYTALLKKKALKD